MEVVLEGVSHTYNGREYALEEVGLSIDGPGLYLVVGPNGSGKTTLLKIVSLNLRPSRGRVIVDGLDAWNTSKREFAELKSKFVYSHDKPILLRGTCRYNLTMGGRLSGRVDEDFMKRLIDLFEAEKLLERKSRELSAGQAKLCSLIRALSVKAEVYALDEPFNSLDSSNASRLLAVLRGLSSTKAVLVSTHFLYEGLLNSAKKTIRLINGKIA
ncbi:ATP-binding cassette domain-containing protein [Thermogladius sp.]|uniref:ATP-binding cassette domain-containing protein n=1 Tax=Thermogladius sp. TaxID=2023064 RepID=UPI003D0A2EFC